MEAAAVAEEVEVVEEVEGDTKNGSCLTISDDKKKPKKNNKWDVAYLKNSTCFLDIRYKQPYIIDTSTKLIHNYGPRS